MSSLPSPARQLFVSCLLILAAACSGGEPAATDAPPTPSPTVAAEATTPEPAPDPSPSATPTATPPPTPSPAPSATPSATPTAEPVTIPDGVAVVLTPLLQVDRPIDLAIRPGSPNLFVATKGGRVLEVAIDGSEGEVVRQLIDIGSAITDGAETGLLGLTFSPSGELFYLMYSDTNGDSRLVELPFENDEVTLADARAVLGVDQPRSNHNGGDIAFGPDGFLYVALGDGGGGGDPFGNGQNTDTLLGSILRIDPTGDPYSIPDDNPFVDGGGRPEIFAFGARNPWRISFDRATGDLWVADVGQGAVEEVDVLYASQGGGRGANLGWNLVEGNLGFASNDPPAEDYVAPIYQYGRGDGCSITGGHVYRGEAIPDLVGSYVFGDYCSGLMWGLASSEAQGPLGRFDLGVSVRPGGLVSFGEGPDGELYVLSFDNTLYRIDPS